MAAHRLGFAAVVGGGAAFRCFMGTELDTLAIGECILRKEDQDLALKRDYRNAFEPD